MAAVDADRVSSETRSASGDAEDSTADVLRLIGLAAMTIEAELESAEIAVRKGAAARATRALAECRRHLRDVFDQIDGHDPEVRYEQAELFQHAKDLT